MKNYPFECDTNDGIAVTNYSSNTWTALYEVGKGWKWTLGTNYETNCALKYTMGTNGHRPTSIQSDDFYSNWLLKQSRPF